MTDYPGDDVAREAWDVSKLTPLPWATVGPCEGQPFPYALARGMDVFAWFRAEADADFAELARKAFDVMMRRGWGVIRDFDGWCVIDDCCLTVHHDKHGDARCFPDPFSALLAADEFVSRSGG